MITLLLLPGMDGTGDLFEPFAAALGSEFTVKVVRYPASEPLGYVELEAFARDRSFPAEGPFVILGESFSGPIAISLAASCSSRLKAVILCCSFVRNPRPLFAASASPAQIASDWRGSRRPIELSFFSAPSSTPALRSALAQAVSARGPCHNSREDSGGAFGRCIKQARSGSAFRCSTCAARAIESFRELRLSLSCG